MTKNYLIAKRVFVKKLADIYEKDPEELMQKDEKELDKYIKISHRIRETERLLNSKQEDEVFVILENWIAEKNCIPKSCNVRIDKETEKAYFLYCKTEGTGFWCPKSAIVTKI